MCEVWKWIIIVTAVPLIAVWVFGQLLVYSWYFNPEAVPQWLRRIPYSPAWWSAFAILVFSVVIYAVHCR